MAWIALTYTAHQIVEQDVKSQYFCHYVKKHREICIFIYLYIFDRLLSNMNKTMNIPLKWSLTVSHGECHHCATGKLNPSSTDSTNGQPFFRSDRFL